MKTLTKWIGTLGLMSMAVGAFAADRPNVLFIAIDDLRPELGCYGSDIAISPNIDALAKTGVLFERAYCQEAICSPSRASLMSGARPDTIRVVENSAMFRELNPDIVTLSQHFIANGYEAVQIGKIFHNLAHSDVEHSWNREPTKVDLPNPFYPYALPENREIMRRNKQVLEAKYGPGISGTGLVQGPAYESADVPDQAYRDGYNADVAIATMKEMIKQGDKPFFMGLGFYKPHLDFIAPKKYWDLYNPVKIPLATQTTGPVDGAAMGRHASFELRVRDGIPKTGDIDPELARTLKHAYLACVSYIDAQIGRVLAALDEAGIRDNTIIVLWGDHGWHLGDMGIWGKATNYEIATRVPLIVSAPGMNASRGSHSPALIELVDMYPTICDLARLAIPTHLEGQSFRPVLVQPGRPWKKAAFSQFPNPAMREWAANPLSPSMHETFFGPLMDEVEGRIIAQQSSRWDRDLFENYLMGYTMRTDRYRLVVWQDVRQPDGDPVDVELYDHQYDPTETVNVAKAQPKVVAQLLKQFRTGWRGNLGSP